MDKKSFKNQISKVGVFLLLLVISSFIAGIYGAVHDQISYTISPEYFTKFKFDQFGMDKEWFGGVRITVAVVGLLATWWVGLLVGFILGVIGLFFPTSKWMFNKIIKSFLVTLTVSSIFGIVGLIYGFLFSFENINWYLPPNLIDKRSFIAIGHMHNFGYLGGLVGLIIGIIFILKSLKQTRASFFK